MEAAPVGRVCVRRPILRSPPERTVQIARYRARRKQSRREAWEERQLAERRVDAAVLAAREKVRRMPPRLQPATPTLWTPRG